MHPDRQVFVGRSTEIALGERAVARGLAGQGTLLLLSGSAGVGKTRLAQAIGALGEERGARMAWGRAWESGGAPTYWPWLQIFRALGISEEAFTPEASTNDIEVSQARFAKFDLAARQLSRAAEDEGIIIALDDLHAADSASLYFLQFLARNLYSARLLIVATYRDLEAKMDGEIGTLLAKISREGTTIAVDPLSREDVLAWIRATSSVDTNSAQSDADSVFEITEGNALYIDELLRVRGASSPASAAKLPGLRALLDEHVAHLSDEAREILQIGSVLGRELDSRLVGLLADRRREWVDEAFREACDVGLLTEGARYSFAHILLRERLYSELSPIRRAQLHGAAADMIRAEGGDLATAAHHLFESESPPLRIAEIAREAARAAMARLAFEQGSQLCERALARHEADDELTFELELAHGEALMRAGKPAAGREICNRAAARAVRLGSAERQAQAALALATEQSAGAVDATMVASLKEALSVLPATDTPLRARLLARSAASLAPPRTDDDASTAMSRGAEAIALARRLGDPDTLLFALHHGGIGLGYLLSFRERTAIMSELYDLADSLKRPAVKLHVGGWRVATLREQGRVAEAGTALHDYARLVDEAPLPHYRWRIPMLQATLATLAADFDTAEKLAGEALAIAEEGAVPAGRIAWVLCRMSIAQLSGKPASIAPDADRIEAIAGRFPGARAWLYAAMGRRDEARPLVEMMGRGASYFSWSVFAAETACLLDDAKLAESVYDRMRVHAQNNSLFWGPSGVVTFGQAQRAAGDLASLLGRSQDARRWYHEAIALGERMQAPALVTTANLGRQPLASSAKPQRVSEPGISEIEMRRDGEMWRVSSSTGVTMSLKNSRGLAYLSDLVSRPGQELHVTQLVEVDDAGSDAGSVLDARAKEQYRHRLEDLRDQLEEARGFGDFARAEKMQAEIEAIADQLAAAVGLGGRDRKVGSHAQRIRINVQRRIRDATKRIATHDPALGRYLDATVRTGMFCMFLPI